MLTGFCDSECSMLYFTWLGTIVPMVPQYQYFTVILCFFLTLFFPLQTVWFDHISLHKKAFIFVVTTDCPSLLVTRMFVCCDQLVMVFSMTYWHPCDTDKMYSFCDHRVQCHLIIARLIQYVIVIMLLCAPLYQCTQPLYN